MINLLREKIKTLLIQKGKNDHFIVTVNREIRVWLQNFALRFNCFDIIYRKEIKKNDWDCID
jgi:hypothetical protein